MSEEEYKKMWDNMLKKLNETERYYLAIVNNQKNQEIDRLNNIINELSNFAIKIYKKELDNTGDWWLQEELKNNFDDINVATNFRLEKELKDSD